MGNTFPPVIHPRLPRLQRLYQDWENRRRGREFPARADFTPHDLKYILGYLTLVDVSYDPLRFRYRIFASNLAARLGKEMTNKSVDELPNPNQVATARSFYTEVVERRVPSVHYIDLKLAKPGVPYNCEFLLLPLSVDGKTIDMIMIGYEPEQ